MWVLHWEIHQCGFFFSNVVVIRLFCCCWAFGLVWFGLALHRTGGRPQDLLYAIQVLYHWATLPHWEIVGRWSTTELYPSPLVNFLFGGRLTKFTLKQVWTCCGPWASIPRVTRITNCATGPSSLLPKGHGNQFQWTPAWLDQGHRRHLEKPLLRLQKCKPLREGGESPCIGLPSSLEPDTSTTWETIFRVSRGNEGPGEEVGVIPPLSSKSQILL